MKKVNFVTKNSLNGGQTGPRMTITEDGKIGIGTETPSKVLDVSGDINFTGTLYQNGSAFSSGGGGGGSSISSISELTDVNLAGITTDQGVKWDGSKLVPTTLSVLEKQGIKELIVTIALKTALNTYQNQGSSKAYFIDGEEGPYLKFTPGKKYRFNQSDATNDTHPVLFYLDAGKTTQYTTGVTTVGTAGSNGAYVEIEITDTTPTKLYYQCGNHGYMGNSILIEGYANLATSSISELTDVNLSGITTNQGVKWDGSKLVPTTLSSGGGGSSISSISELTDVNLAGITTNQGVKWDGSKLVPTTLSSGGGSGGVSNGSDVSFNSIDIDGVIKGTAGSNNSQLSLGSHIIPTQNAQFDLGNAEYKIRHLFLSDNSLWLGDDHKMDIGSGKIKFKKRDKTKVPKGIKTAYGEDDATIKTKLVALWNATPELKDGGYGDSGTGDIDANAFNNFKLHDWEKLANHLQTQTGGNFPASQYNPGGIDDIIGMDDPNYFEEENNAGSSISSINELNNVDLTGISTDQGVKWDGSKLVPVTLPVQESGPKYHYTVTNGGASNYKFSGPGVLGNENNPTMTFYKGSTYVLNVNASGHPFYIKTANSTGTSNAVSSDWVTNNGTQAGQIVFTVPMNAPGQYHYNCQFHSSMHGVINIA